MYLAEFCFISGLLLGSTAFLSCNEHHSDEGKMDRFKKSSFFSDQSRFSNFCSTVRLIVAVFTGFALSFAVVYFENGLNCGDQQICLGFSLKNSGFMILTVAVISLITAFYSSSAMVIDFCRKSRAWSIIPFQQRVIHKYRLSQSVINLVCGLPLSSILILSKIAGVDSSGSNSKLVDHLLIWMVLFRPFLNSLTMMTFTIISRQAKNANHQLLQHHQSQMTNIPSPHILQPRNSGFQVSGTWKFVKNENPNSPNFGIQSVRDEFTFSRRETVLERQIASHWENGPAIRSGNDLQHLRTLDNYHDSGNASQNSTPERVPMNLPPTLGLQNFLQNYPKNNHCQPVQLSHHNSSHFQQNFASYPAPPAPPSNYEYSSLLKVQENEGNPRQINHFNTTNRINNNSGW